MQGYEGCEKNFIFHDIPACQISFPAGQNPAAELQIFQKDNLYFYIAMSYRGTEPVPFPMNLNLPKYQA